MKIFSDDVRKLMLAGLGAAASAVEWTGEKLDEILQNEAIRDKLDELAKKGEEILHGQPFDTEEPFTQETAEEENDA